MSDNLLRKIKNLLDLANDADDEESMTALAKAQELMILYNVSEDDIFQQKQSHSEGIVLDKIIYSGRPHKWLYRLASVISENFRVKFYYESGTEINLRFIGLEYDLEIAEVTFQYAKASISYLSKKYLQQPEIKRKWKRKWGLKQDYIEGYLTGLYKTFEKHVLTNGYEVSLQLPNVVTVQIKELGLIKNSKNLSHEITDNGAFFDGYREGLKFNNHDQIETM